MLKVPVHAFLTLAAVAALMVAPIANAQVSNLFTIVEDDIDPADPAALVNYTAIYGNKGADAASSPRMTLFLPSQQPAPLQDYINGDAEAIRLVDDVLGASLADDFGECPSCGLYWDSYCDGFLIFVTGDEIPAGFAPSNTGEVTYTMEMPTMLPMTPTVAVTGYSAGLNYGVGQSDACDDLNTWFGPRVSETAVINAEIELVNDGDGDTIDGCQALIGFTPGNIAWVDRGECAFEDKAVIAQNAGAVAIIIGNNVEDTNLGADDITNLACTDFCGFINIPSVFVSTNDNVAVQALLAAGTVMGTFGAVESDTMTTHSNVWEDATIPTDSDQSNNDWYETTTLDLWMFTDGFESGDVSTWSSSY